ncbi:MULTISPECIES: 2-phospho-L-lactate transferase [Gordonia]|uniref:2-phospho-L-lactate transferase n=1 Tax=Gordonia TaxID=2053 RepID=UPI00030C7AE0|nr:MULTISPECIES: 2-phospho-L-lactate transferase [Gordonia]MBE7194873.1 2-phospho-L-lactate transferase [Gordonia polyisoprenivorans]MDF3283712.1 2-phospho-L-lactate transferase [Gordonia sp. N1V]QUD84389.1 2-phospho-L-lactate transferase [Gordonia polyisoprenivorans]UZF54542.1 2-phospho-L-lactate transferase [Gordonia polyisoprenivorans]WCB35759.1 2-phospho-L-lactate transferase [Gordonia polyisoprenivorans]
MKVTVLVGGVGGARFLQGVRELFGPTPFPAPAEDSAGDESATPPGPHEITAIVNVGDDAWMHGVRICPDLDTCMYTLGGGIDTERGWGRRGETWHAKEELAAYGADPDWFGLGDRDLATHLIRTQMLDAGYRLSDVTAALCKRWQPGVRLLPATDDRHETHVVVSAPGGEDGAQVAIHFQEWWVRHRAKIPTFGFAQVGSDDTHAAAGVIEAIADADVVLLAPSNPVVSIGAVISVPGVRSALRTTGARVVGVSPVIDNRPLRGMADECLSVIGVETTAEAIAAHYGARSGNGLLDGWLIADGDEAAVEGISIGAAPLLMTDPIATAHMVRAACALVGVDTPEIAGPDSTGADR